MKIMIEVSGGCITGITTTEPCEIYLVDHDNLRESVDDDGYSLAATRETYQPDCITHEGGHVAYPGASETPEFDAYLDEALSPYRAEMDPSEGSEFHHSGIPA